MGSIYIKASSCIPVGFCLDEKFLRITLILGHYVFSDNQMKIHVSRARKNISRFEGSLEGSLKFEDRHQTVKN